ncbi:EAL domain, c-di-GMP-specific phosphodiesterase class I (or its enzymatically inactive variant) [Modicisalibacter ilicicola DSM 19980]|uniref:EAL domain, c-di-GMP-specific phosphodiesterase class I (Or its enzymatically inactive variant) n=1 Tax=Modicisalibacter ilicicola DSM 19980 TaxID=1121942 RepID=A0A1M4ZGL5_9GAMM|nr:EAL domain-containing protein [Halomonas ilicicola]SHF16942.1 EAL domain, c-di-GMP-specific phosphodiesterase class I (or its enzymatically inactive variant) [Halomonas ilicicola DSM 19980]
MSLIKQLWLTLLVVLALSFAGSLTISLVTGTHYFEEELRTKNIDNANALALSLSLIDKDPWVIEGVLAAQFDTGHYRRIELVAPEGEPLMRRASETATSGIPAWFVRLVELSIPPGEAVILQDQKQYATVVVESHQGHAYRLLWQGTIDLLIWFTIASVIGASLVWWIMGTIRRPLRSVIAQASDIGQRRFSVCEELPRPRELRQVVLAMNRLSGAMRALFAEESRKLDRLQRQLQQDDITGVTKRGIFLHQVDTALNGDDHGTAGHIAMARLAGLNELNERLGYTATNQLLSSFADMLVDLASHYDGAQVGRLNGSDFALLLPGNEATAHLQAHIEAQLNAQFDGASLRVASPMAVAPYHQGDRRRELFSALDGALAKAEERGGSTVEAVAVDLRHQIYRTHKQWRHALDQAMKAEGIRLARHPVLDDRGRLIHYEACAQLKLEDEWESEGTFLPWLSRTGLSSEFDLAAVKTALAAIDEQGRPLSIRLSKDALGDARFATQLRQCVALHPEAARRLWIEVPESTAVRNKEIFRNLSLELRPLGCKIGLAHAGPEFARLPDLHDLGLSYMKIDASLVRDIHSRKRTHPLLGGIVTLCHSLGIKVIGESVTSHAERRCLLDLGLDGVTGPGIRLHLGLVKE